MDALQKLEKAQENKFLHEQNILFKAKIRRNRMLGLWAADLMDFAQSDADKYAVDIVELHLKDTGKERLNAKILNDFNQAGVDKSEHQIERQIHDFMAEAVHQVNTE